MLRQGYFSKSLEKYEKISGSISGKVKKIEAQADDGFLIKKTCTYIFTEPQYS